MMVRFKFPSWMGEHPRHGSPWTPEEDRLLRHCWVNGIGVQRLMKMTGRNECAIDCRLAKFFPDYQRQSELRAKIQKLEADLRVFSEELAELKMRGDR